MILFTVAPYFRYFIGSDDIVSAFDFCWRAAVVDLLFVWVEFVNLKPKTSLLVLENRHSCRLCGAFVQVRNTCRTTTTMKYNLAFLLALVAGAQAAGKPKFSVGTVHTRTEYQPHGVPLALTLLLCDRRDCVPYNV